MTAETDQKPRNLTATDADIADDQLDIPPEIMERLPPDTRKIVEMSLSMHRFGPEPHPVLKKITPEHISTVLALSDSDGKRAFWESVIARSFTAFYVLAFIGLFVFLTLTLAPLDKELYSDVVRVVLIFAGGFGSGFGVKSLMDRRK